MALFTPRGLKVRLPREYAFALMARVYPQTDAFRVLQLTEEVENLPSLASFLAGLVAFAARLEPLHIGLVVFTIVSVFKLVHLFGFFALPFTLLLPLSRVFSVINGFGFLFLALLLFGYFTTGWGGILAFLVGRVACGVLFSVAEWFWGRRAFRLSGVGFTASERSFFHAFRLVATRQGASTDLSVSDEETDPAHWRHVFYDLSIKWPVVVQRFTDEV